MKSPQNSTGPGGAALSPLEIVLGLGFSFEHMEKFGQIDMHQALMNLGISLDTANRAYKFIQIAWARAMLDGHGIKFSPDYHCFNKSGEVIESGPLAGEPFYTAAMEVVSMFEHSPGFKALALTASETYAVGDMLQQGLPACALATSPPALFMEKPTAAGMEKVTRFLRGGEQPPADSPKGPWWKFW